MQYFYVEVFIPPYPSKGRKYRVFKKLVQDALSPNLVILYKAWAWDKQDAIAQCLSGKAEKV